MTDNDGAQDPLRNQISVEQPEGERGGAQPELLDSTLEEDVTAALGFLQSMMDNSAPVTDVHAAYVMRMTADLPVPTERLGRIRERVLRSADIDRHSEKGRSATDHTAGITASTAEGGQLQAIQQIEDHGAASGAVGAATRPEHIAGPRPSFWKRCRELKRQIKDVAPQLRLNDEVLLELDHGHARQVPRALLAAAASFVDFDAPTLARCFAPNTGNVLKMAAHDQSGHAPTAPQLYDFLTIIEESSLSEADKAYWRDIAGAETAGPGCSHT